MTNDRRDGNGDYQPPNRPRPTVASTAATAVLEADVEIQGMSDQALAAGIERLRHQRGAVILAHNYQIPQIQDLADFVGDSLQLSQQAAASDKPLIVFCGVHFMAETDAAVKADYCCTSSNAVKIVQSIPTDREILFLPDMFLGLYIEHMAGRKLHLWLGECHVHAGIRSEDVTALMDAHPGADLLLHPECGCISQCMFAVSEGELPANRTFILSTGGMAKHARECTAPVDLIGTEVGMLHRLHQEAPTKTFIPLKDDAICDYMKTITVPKLYRALRDDVYAVTVPEPIASRARLAIDRMMTITEAQA